MLKTDPEVREVLGKVKDVAEEKERSALAIIAPKAGEEKEENVSMLLCVRPDGLGPSIVAIALVASLTLKNLTEISSLESEILKEYLDYLQEELKRIPASDEVPPMFL